MASKHKVVVLLHEANLKKKGHYFVIFILPNQEKIRSSVSDDTDQPNFNSQPIEIVWTPQQQQEKCVVEVQLFYAAPLTKEKNQQEQTTPAQQMQLDSAKLLGTAKLPIHQYTDLKHKQSSSLDFATTKSNSTEILNLGALAITLSAPAEKSFSPVDQNNTTMPQSTSPKFFKAQTRPLSATKTADTLQLCIRSGYYFDDLLKKCYQQDSGESNAFEGKSSFTYLVARLGTITTENLFPEFHLAFEPYTSSYSHFSATGAIQGEHPIWNEVVLVSIPSATVLDPSGACLRLEIIHKTGEIDSDRENCDDDMLMGYISIPLTNIKVNEEAQVCIDLVNHPDNPTRLTFSLYRRQNILAQIDREQELQQQQQAPQTENEQENRIEPTRRLEILLKDLSFGPVDISPIEPIYEKHRFRLGSEIVSAEEAQERIFQLKGLKEFRRPSLPSSSSEEEQINLYTTANRHTPDGLYASTTKAIKWEFPILVHTLIQVNAVFLLTLIATTSTGEELSIGYGTLALPDVDLSKQADEDEEAGFDIDVELIKKSINFVIFNPVFHLEHAITLGIEFREWLPSAFLLMLRTRINNPSSDRNKTFTNRLQLSCTIGWLSAIFRGLTRHSISSIFNTCELSSFLIRHFQEQNHIMTQQNLLHQQQQQYQLSIDTLTQQQILQYQTTTETYQTQLQSATKDLLQKQTLIDRLMNEIDKRSEAIKNCGLEIVELRKINAQGTKQIQLLEKQVQGYQLQEEEQRKEIEQTLKQAPFWNGKQDINQIMKEFCIVHQKCQNLAAENHRLEEQMRQMKAQTGNFRRLQASYAELEKAHVLQAKYLQKLQQDQQNIQVFKNTIKTQERVIAKLEGLIETKLAELKGGNIQGSTVHEQMHQLRLQNQQLTAQLGGKGNVSTGSKIQSSARIKALEEQLVQVATEAASEVSSLKMRILELEMNL